VQPHRETTLEFHSNRAATGPLIWAQRAIWDVVRWLPPDDITLNQIGHCAVPAGRDLDEVLDALRTLVLRHDSLHTLFEQTPDGPVQHVRADGEIPVGLHELDDRSVDEATAVVGGVLGGVPFRHDRDLPLRLAVLTRDGRPAVIVLVASHLALDGWSFYLVREDLAQLLSAPEEVAAPGQQPLERVLYEASPLGRDREAKALAYWRKHLTAAPAAMIEPASPDPTPELDWARIESGALALATDALAARTGVPGSTVLLAASALLLAAHLGEEQAMIRMIVSTRFQPASRRLIGAFNQNALFPITVADEPVGGYLRRAANAVLIAYAHSEYDPAALDRLIDDVARQRGLEPGGYCFFNDARFGPLTKDTAKPAEPADLADLIQSALPATKVTPLTTDRRPMTANFFQYLNDLSDRAVLTLCVQRGFLGHRGAADFLIGLQTLVVGAATDPDATVRELSSLGA
jgi:hypothetical protein